uniref:Uncharacterized protein n=1 Tax=Amphimedon queenslandica TaxID=400682 RepID=A0A1X7SSL0_AMPQE
MRRIKAYLQVVIPYRHTEGSDISYSVPLLKQWITILKAMAERSPNLPTLISTYLQSEVIDSD